jgi:hypothetical protein
MRKVLILIIIVYSILAIAYARDSAGTKKTVALEPVTAPFISGLLFIVQPMSVETNNVFK